MSWDWEKLQEKRQRQKGNSFTTPDDAERSASGGGSGDEQNQLLTILTPKNIILVALGALLLWLSSGFFILGPGEEGVILRFGKYSRTLYVGPNYHLPYPVEKLYRVNTEALRYVEIGEKENSSSGRGSTLRAAPVPKAEPIYASEKGAYYNNFAEDSSRNTRSAMFTGDENIIHVNFTVQYSISNAEEFLFNVKNPPAVIEHAAESAVREVVARKKVEVILTQGREAIQSEVQSILTGLLDSYKMGVKIHAVQLGDVYPPAEVRSAFIDVASAREAKITIENEAEAYRAEIVPVAAGTARSIINAAKAYEQLVVQEAEGQSAAFSLLSKEYALAPDINKKRMYFDAMREVFSSDDIEKIIVSSKLSKLLPLLPLGGELPQN